MKLNYKKYGAGRPLIILHGLFGMLDNWLTMGKRFSSEFEVFLVDQRNHGKSPHTEEFSYAHMADDLLEFIEDHHLKGVCLIGHSMGGKTIIEFAHEHSLYISKMIIADMGPKGYPVRHDGLIEAMQNLNLSLYKSRAEADFALKAYISNTAIRQFLLKNIQWTQGRKLAWKFNLKILSKNLSETHVDMLSYRISVPTLLLYGEASDYVLKEDWPAIKEVFSDVTLESIPNAGHWLHAEEPELFYQKCLHFLNT